MSADSKNKHTVGKPDQSGDSRRRAFKRRLNETMAMLWQAIIDAEAEGKRLDQQLRAAEQANDPDELAKVIQAQDQLLDRINRFGAQIPILSQQLDLMIETLDDAAFQACVRKFHDQFGDGRGGDVH